MIYLTTLPKVIDQIILEYLFVNYFDHDANFNLSTSSGFLHYTDEVGQILFEHNILSIYGIPYIMKLLKKHDNIDSVTCKKLRKIILHTMSGNDINTCYDTLYDMVLYDCGLTYFACNMFDYYAKCIDNQFVVEIFDKMFKRHNFHPENLLIHSYEFTKYMLSKTKYICKYNMIHKTHTHNNHNSKLIKLLLKYDAAYNVPDWYYNYVDVYE